LPKTPYDVYRNCPWENVPKNLRTTRRCSRYYYLLTIYLRKHPPNIQSFRIRDLANDFDTEYYNVYQTIRAYSNDSKRFLSYVHIPTTVRDENSWQYAIGKLHKDGFYFVLPKSHHSGEWVEPSFRQFESYDHDVLREALNRAITRLRDGQDFGLTFDGLNIRQELDYIEKRRKMLELEDKTEDEK